MSFDADTGANPPADPGDVHGVAEQILATLEREPDETPADPSADGDTMETTTSDQAEESDYAAEAVAEFSGQALHDVVIDGHKQRVTLEELRKGYSRQQDYSRKTAALAEHRRALETERGLLQETLDAFIRDSAAIDPVLAEGAATDWEKLAAEQPEAYAQRRAAFDRRVARMEEAKALRQAISAKEDAARAEAFDAFAGQQRRALLQRMPELGDPAKRASIAAELSAYAASHGFSDAEQARILDHRLVEVFHDAMLYRKQAEARAKLAGKWVEPASRTQAPRASRDGGVRRSQQLTTLKRNALRTGRVDDVVDSILAHLDEDE